MATNDYFNFNPGNKDYDTFQNRISEGQQGVEAARQQYEQAQPRVENAYQAQQQAMQNRQSYGDLLSQAKSAEGVDESKQQYQRDVEAVNSLQSAMNTLPSSINANSNVVLTQAQRQAALGNQMEKYLNSYDYATRQAATSGDLYSRAQDAAFTAAQAGATEQQQNIANAMQAYSTEMNNLQNLYTQLYNEKQLLHNTYGDLYDEEYRRNMAELEQIAAEKDRELQRELAAQEDATKRWIQERQSADARYSADASIRASQIMADLQNQAAERATEQQKAAAQAQNRASAISGFNQYMQNAQKQLEEANNFWNIGNWFTGGKSFSDFDPYGSDFYRYMNAQGYDQDTIDYFKNLQSTDQQRYSDLFNW